MQVSAFPKEEIGVGHGTYKEGGGWIDIRPESGNHWVIHFMTPDKIRRLAQMLVEVAQEMSQEQEQLCPATN